MDANGGAARSGQGTGGEGGVPLASLSTRNVQSTDALCKLFGVDRERLDRLIDDAWDQEARKDSRLMERALSAGVPLEVAYGGESATLKVERNRRRIAGRPLYVIWPQGQAASAAQAGPPRDGGVRITKAALERLSGFMPDLAEADIRSAVEEAIGRAEREGKVDTRWRPRNFQEDRGECLSLWLPAGRDGDRDVRIAYSREAGGARRVVFYVERQRAMKMLEGFAYMGDWPEVLEALAGLARPEPWDGGDGSRSILKSYLKATYARVERQGKVCFSEDGHAAFDTGLATAREDRIVAVFGPNDRPGARQQHRFEGFVTPQDRWMGRAILSIVSATERATYVEWSSDLVMGWSDMTPTLSEDHILIDRVDRLPTEFLRSVDQMDGEWRDLVDAIAGRDADEQARENAYEGLRGILRRNDALFKSLRTLIRAAAEKAFEDLRIYPYNALPVYNPERDDLAFVLPIHLMSRTGRPNAALLVEEVGEGVFRAHTVLTMEMAYVDARVISPPKNSWLAEQYSEDARRISELEEEVARLRARLGEGAARSGQGAGACFEEVRRLEGENARLESAVEELESRVGSLAAEAATWRERAQGAEREARRAREDCARRVEATIAIWTGSCEKLEGETRGDSTGKVAKEPGNPGFPSVPQDNKVESAAERDADGSGHGTEGSEATAPQEGDGIGISTHFEEENDLEDSLLDDEEDKEDMQAVLHQDGTLVIAKELSDFWDLEYDRTQEKIDTWVFWSDDGFSKRRPAPWFKWRRHIVSVVIIGVDGKRYEDYEGEQDPWSMVRWFAELPNLKTVRLENVDLRACSSLKQLFYKCESLETVEFRDTPIGPSTSVADIFVGCPQHIQLIISGRAPKPMEERLLAELALRNPRGTERSEWADLDGLTWDQIAKISSLISEEGEGATTARMFGLCNRNGNPHQLKKNLTISDGSQVTVSLERLPSRKSREMVFMFNSPVASRRMMKGGLFARASWGESEARAWLNGEFLSTLPKDLVDAMAVSSIGSYAGGIERTLDRVYLPSIEDFPKAERADSLTKGEAAKLIWLRDSISTKCFCAISADGKKYVHESMEKERRMCPLFGI